VKELLVGCEASERPKGSASAEGRLVGVRVRNFTSSFEITACGSKGTKPAPRNLA
jgi:hypothetical protein